MVIKNITDIDGFFAAIDKCTGRVEMVTSEGDRINLKSILSQYVSLAKLFKDGMIPEVQIVTYNPADLEKLIDYMMLG